MLLPASAEDLKRQGHITINPKTEGGEEVGEIKEEKDGVYYFRILLTAI